MEAHEMTTATQIHESPIEQVVPPAGKPFLTAAWRDLLMLNFEVDPSILEFYVPKGVELDLHEGRALASIVAFMFEEPRLHGVPAPFVSQIPEVNLRFYVKRERDDCRRLGVVFIKEIAPWRAFPMAMVANHWYHEHYHLMPMRHQLVQSGEGTNTRRHVHYAWRYRGHWNRLNATASGSSRRPAAGSEEAFILDHWFAYTRQPDGTCVERQVGHPLWTIRRVAPDSVNFRCDVAKLYGDQFVDALRQPPTSVFYSEGSAVGVYGGTRV